MFNQAGWHTSLYIISQHLCFHLAPFKTLFHVTDHKYKSLCVKEMEPVSEKGGTKQGIY